MPVIMLELDMKECHNWQIHAEGLTINNDPIHSSRSTARYIWTHSIHFTPQVQSRGTLKISISQIRK